MSKLFLDTETAGFEGFVVLIQYAYDDGPIHLYEVWKEPVEKTLKLIEEFTEHDFVGFNNSFDWFHLCKCYTVFREYSIRFPELASQPPELDRVVECEEAGMDGPCIKPRRSCDLMLWSRKLPKTQTLMNRGDIRIRKVPVDLAYPLADELDDSIELPDIYWTRQQDSRIRWRVYEIDEQPHFRDLVLKFNPAGGLKYLAEFVLGEKPPFHFTDIECDRYPRGLGYAPSARAAREHFGPDAEIWPDVIHHHIEHWHSNEHARKYAELDVVYTRKLYHAFDAPEPGDDDSELACMVGAVRWHGYTVDIDAIKRLRLKSLEVVQGSPINVNSTREVRQYLVEVMDPIEQVLIQDSTKKAVLEEIAGWEDNLEAAARAQRILDVRLAMKEVELYDKLILAGRLHADLNVIGTMSSRMSGAGGLNVQGIKHSKEVRSCFPLAWGDLSLCGGDMSAFEVTLADAVYDDPDLRKVLKSGEKIHAYFGTLLFPGKTYQEIIDSEGTDNDMYFKAKSGVFAMIYGGTAFTLHTNLGIPLEIAEKAIEGWQKMFPGIGRTLREVADRFSAIVQNGPGFAWTDCDTYIETAMGFKRSFELEITVMRCLFELAQNPPKEWDRKKIKVVRRERIQTAAGAVRSALYGAAFSVQNSNIRAANNHLIQSYGATICKRLQAKLWELQPSGVNPWKVAPLNIHDELMCPTSPELVETTTRVMQETIEELRSMVPLLGMEWSEGGSNWSECKKGGNTKRTVNIKAA